MQTNTTLKGKRAAAALARHWGLHALSRDAESKQPCTSPAKTKVFHEQDPRCGTIYTKGADSFLKSLRQRNATTMQTPSAASLSSPQPVPALGSSVGPTPLGVVVTWARCAVPRCQGWCGEDADAGPHPPLRECRRQICPSP